MPKTIRASTEARRRRRERAEQIADAPGGRARVFAAALSDAGFAALCRAVETLDREHMPASVWTWPGACNKHGQLDPAGSFRRRPWSDHAAAVYSAADLVENWRECGTTPEDTRHFWRWLDEPNGAPSEYGTRLDGGGDHERADALAVRVLRALPAGGRQSALTVVVEAAGLSEPGDPFRPVTRASLPRLDRAADRALPDLASMPAATPGGQLALPGFKAASGEAAAWLLRLFDRAGGQSLAGGRGAPWMLRIWIAAILQLPVGQRTGAPVDLSFTVGEIADWLHPNSWTNRRRDWGRLLEALDALRRLTVPIPYMDPHGTLWHLPTALVSAPALDGLRWDDGRYPVALTVRVPFEAARGARLDWPRLVAYGADNAALYRMYLSVVTALDRSAYHGAPVTRQIGAPVRRTDGTPRRRKGGALMRRGDALVPHPYANMAPAWTDADAARFVGFDPTHHEARRRARKALERLAADGVIDLEPTRTGRIRLFGPSRK